ncbi:hypothetical protein [Shimia gijangensis]|uniref:hypothetical protein n=1 Tax=Shimia gijangensis TaxID=1470563 RepID=UPI001114CAF1|nr:hypothetical protein [Shimia gijangensis]
MAAIETLNETPPMTTKLEHALGIGVGFGTAWYSSQKEHWMRWLKEYDTPGVYGRRPNSGHSCQFIYNQLQCPPMVFWLGEALGAPKLALRQAYAAATGVLPHHARQTAAIRREIPWRTIEIRIRQLSEGGATRCNGHTDLTASPCAKKLQRVATPPHSGCSPTNKKLQLAAISPRISSATNDHEV